MIVKMKLINIIGPKDDIDRMTNTYLSKYEIQLESALSELKTVDNLKPFAQANPYKETITRLNEYTKYLDDNTQEIDENIELNDILNLVTNLDKDYNQFLMEQETIKSKRNILREKLKSIAPFKGIDYNVHDVLNYKYINHHFGRIAIEYFKELDNYIKEAKEVILVEGQRDESYVYGVYFVCEEDEQKVDAVFKSLHFETIILPDEYDATPSEAFNQIQKEIRVLTKEIENIDEKIKEIFKKNAGKILGAKKKIEEISKNFDIRKLAASLDDDREDYYILCGWMSETDIDKFLEDSAHDKKVFVIVEEEEDGYFSSPPTQLSNPKIFKPFEMFVKMYGLPAHDELDPTIFVALTYAFIFGAMFGDVGQGLCLLIGGGLLYFIKKLPLAGIISSAGFFSVVFGFLYGSIFGFEDIIKPLWLKPISHMTTLPFVGRLNTVFVVAILFGMFNIIVAMIFNIINGIKSKRLGETLFSANGVAGLVFYASAIITMLLFMCGKTLPATIVLVVMFVIPLILILFKEPLTRVLEKKKEKMEESKAMFIVQGFFEIFETLLSYFSNTLSFVRVGAFAISHGAMMEVVLMLAGVESGSINWIVVILGNLFVCGMEGLIVGIQVLRLEYYEMFSRFYKGSGREFKPFINKKEK